MILLNTQCVSKSLHLSWITIQSLCHLYVIIDIQKGWKINNPPYTWTNWTMIIFPLNTGVPYLLQRNKGMRWHSFGFKGSPWTMWLPFTSTYISYGACHPCLYENGHLHQDALMENSGMLMLKELFLDTKKRENSSRVQHISCLLQIQ